MNLTLSGALALTNAIKSKIIGLSEAKSQTNKGVDVGISPPFVFLTDIAKAIKGSSICLAAQNIHCKDSGAYTGEISGLMIKEIGCTHVIIGHSERRHIFGETNGFINEKLKKCLSIDLTPIFCVGERLEEREEGKTNDVIKNQLCEGLKDVDANQIQRLVIAYEPVWAIGTGKTASPEQANEAHSFIRDCLTKEYGKGIADAVVIQYGGSVRPDNIRDLLLQTEIDGALVGGASLDASSFVRIIEIANECSKVKVERYFCNYSPT